MSRTPTGREQLKMMSVTHVCFSVPCVRKMPSLESGLLEVPHGEEGRAFDSRARGAVFWLLWLDWLGNHHGHQE